MRLRHSDSSRSESERELKRLSPQAVPRPSSGVTVGPFLGPSPGSGPAGVRPVLRMHPACTHLRGLRRCCPPCLPRSSQFTCLAASQRKDTAPQPLAFSATTPRCFAINHCLLITFSLSASLQSVSTGRAGPEATEPILVPQVVSTQRDMHMLGLQDSISQLNTTAVSGKPVALTVNGRRP